MRKFSAQHKLEGGFTLLELLLVIGVAAVLFLGISQITASWIDSEVSTGAGQHLQRVSTVVQNYVEANWNNETEPLTPTSDALHDASSGWTGLKNSLQQEGLLSNGELRSPLNTVLKIGYVVDAGIYRATIYAPQSLIYKRVAEASRQAGNTGGMISFFPDSTNAFGAFGQWIVPITKLLPGGTAPCIPSEGNSCLVAVISYNQQTLCGPYLYRTNVAGTCTGGNTMTTDLRMASHDIVNAGNLDMDNMTVRNEAVLGQMVVDGKTTLAGPVTSSGGMIVNTANSGGNPAIRVSGDTVFSGDVTQTGNLNIVGDLNTTSIATPKIETNEMHAQNLTMTNGTLAVDKEISVGENVNVTGAGSQILAATVNAGEVNTNNGAVNVGTMNVQNTMNISGQVNVTGTTLSADRLIANDCTEIAGKKYGTCP